MLSIRVVRFLPVCPEGRDLANKMDDTRVPHDR